MKRLAALLAVCLIGGCASAPFKGYQGPQLPDSELALLDWTAADAFCVFEIDGHRVPQAGLFTTGRLRAEKAWLRPGTRKILIHGGSCGFSSEHYIQRRTTYRKSVTIDLQAGHHYAVIHKSVMLAGRGIAYHHYVWIEDRASGVVLAGERP